VGASPAPLTRSRVSAAERERIAERLRGACADERLSVETFIARLDSVYSVRTHADLAQLVADIPEPSWLSRTCLEAVTVTSRWLHQVGAAWREPRAVPLVLPNREQVVLGRSRTCDRVVLSPTVSRRHALLRHVEGRWLIQDCGSANGTFLNGWRVEAETEVHTGDELAVGDVRFVVQSAPADLRHVRDEASPAP
jgi:FHA domain-containing protein/uncharacterized protein DUF1707